MASGKTHTRVTVFHGTYFSLTLWLFGFYGVQWLALGFFYQIFTSPDRDLEGTIGEYYLRKYTGFLHIYWQNVWYPYAVSMKHRGKSHAVYGTIVRLIYLVSPFIITFTPFRDNHEIHPSRLLWRCAIAQVLCIPIVVTLVYIFVYYGAGALCLFITGVWLGDLLHCLWDQYFYTEG